MCMNVITKGFYYRCCFVFWLFHCQPEKMVNGMAYRACNISDEVMLFNYNDAY